jgi:hypothetical protein
LAIHFLTALAVAAVYFLGSRAFPLLIERALLCGVLYGLPIHLFMNFVVIPVSAIGPRPFVARSFAAFLIVHMVVVGPSIALTVRRYAR